MGPPDDNSGRRLTQPTPATTPTAATTPEIAATIADAGHAVAIELPWTPPRGPDEHGRLARELGLRSVTPLEAALAYQQAGWSVIPVSIADKRALVSWTRWQQIAPDPEQLRVWWRRRPRANLALVTGHVSGVVVVDIDPRAGGDCALAELGKRHGDLPWSAVVETPSGGWHVFMRHPGGRIPNSASRVGLGVDVRGDGGIALLPPSRRPDGCYRWALGGPSSVPTMPAAWAELLRPAPKPANQSTRTASGAAQRPGVGSQGPQRPPTGRTARRRPPRPPTRARRAAQQLPLLVRQAPGRDGRPRRTHPLAPGPGRHRTGVRAGTGRDRRHPRQRSGGRAVTGGKTPAQTPVSRSTDDLDRRLLATLAAHEGPAGICPRVPRLAALLGVSESTLHRALRRLVNAGQLERIPVFERDDDPEWRRRGHQGSRPRRQTTNSYRLLVTPGSTTLNPGLKLTPGPGVTTSEEIAAQTPVSPDLVTPLQGKEPADGGYQGTRDEVEYESALHEPIEIAVEPPEDALLDHDPDASEILATLGGTFGAVQVVSGPAIYRMARGRVIDLATAPTQHLLKALEQLDSHTCRRVNGDGTERCMPGQPCGRHRRRRRAR